MKNQQQLDKIIFTFWNNYLNFKQIPDKWEIIIIPHHIRFEIPQDECIIFEYFGHWKIISVHEKYVEDIKTFIASNGYGFEELKNYFKNILQKDIVIFWPITSLYLYSMEKLLPIHWQIKKIKLKDKDIYNNFMESCTHHEEKEVNMDIEDSSHHFFVLYNDWNVVSMGNYSIDKETDIAHIWIITPKKYQRNGYGKHLVNGMIHDILNNNLIPQYRVKNTNKASIRIAKQFWFTSILESCTLKAAHK